MKRAALFVFIYVAIHFITLAVSAAPADSQACVNSLMAGDRFASMIQDLIQLKLKADLARTEGDGVRNNFQLLFEDLYRELLQQNKNLPQLFAAEFIKSRVQDRQWAIQNWQERKAREQQTRVLTYQMSSRTNLRWPLSAHAGADLPRIIRGRVEFYSKPAHKYLQFEVQHSEPQFGHTERVTSVSSVSENRFITTSFDRTAILWQVDHQAQRATPLLRLGINRGGRSQDGHIDSVNAVAVVSENLFVTVSDDHTAILWQIDETDLSYKIIARLGEPLNRNVNVGHVGWLNSVVPISPHSFITTSFDHTAIIWELDKNNRPQIYARLGQSLNQDESLGHTANVRNAEWVIYDGEVIVRTTDVTGRRLIWERVDLNAENSL